MLVTAKKYNPKSLIHFNGIDKLLQDPYNLTMLEEKRNVFTIIRPKMQAAPNSNILFWLKQHCRLSHDKNEGNSDVAQALRK